MFKNLRRKKGGYFDVPDGAPAPVVVDVDTRARFSDVDPMGVVWFGRYMRYFEEGSEALGRRCGLSYRDFHEAGLRALVASCHIDYHSPIPLDAEFTIRAMMFWSETTVLNSEYRLIKKGGALAACGYMVQVLVTVDNEVCLVSPELLLRCRQRWVDGEFYD
jgi:acyl-CoA thioester hydrolase